MEKVLIGIHDKPRAGKDTIANHLVEHYGLLRYGPSFPVKKATAAMFNVPEEKFWDDKVKDTVDPYWGISYREMAQKVGKESSRDVFGEDFWMRHVELVWSRMKSMIKLAGPLGMVLADIRYANEAQWVRANGGLMIFVVRENRDFVSNETHAAEQGLSTDLADVVIPNNGTVAELYQRVDLVVGPLMEA